MNKIFVFILGICAFFVALFYVLTKRNFNPDLAKERFFVKKRFLVTVAVLVAFLSNKGISATVDKVKSAENLENITEIDKLKQLKDYKEWKQIKENWENVVKIPTVAEYDSLSKIVEEKEKENWAFLSKLVNVGLFTVEGAKVFNDIYGQRISHHLQITSTSSCYYRWPLDANLTVDIEDRLEVLKEISKKNIVKEQVTMEAKGNLLKDMEGILLVKEAEAEGVQTGNWEKYDKDEQKIQAYLLNIKDLSKIKEDPKVRKSVKEAMEIILLIYKE